MTTTPPPIHTQLVISPHRINVSCDCVIKVDLSRLQAAHDTITHYGCINSPLRV